MGVLLCKLRCLFLLMNKIKCILLTFIFSEDNVRSFVDLVDAPHVDGIGDVIRDIERDLQEMQQNDVLDELDDDDLDELFANTVSSLCHIFCVITTLFENE